MAVITSNFAVLDKQWPTLAKLGLEAEKYAHSDPQSAVIKLRCFSEVLIGLIFRELNIPSLSDENFFERLNNKTFVDIMERPVLDKLHAIRMNGNKAAHHVGVSTNDALWLIREAYLISCWLYGTYGGANQCEYPDFVEPKPRTNELKQMRRSHADIERQLNEKTQSLQAALQELEAAQKAEKQAQTLVAELDFIEQSAKLESFKNAGSKAASHIDFSEDETLRRISMQDVFAEYELTPGQTELVSRLDAFLSSRSESVFMLKGYAGTGKTFITKGLTEYLKASGRNFILAAPTGKASKVIAEKTKTGASTIHKAIYSFKDIKEYRVDQTDGTETYKVYAELAVNEHSADAVYIFDESSMISDIYHETEFFRFGTGRLLTDLLKHVNLDHNDHNKKIIFIGDDAQLPPVGMKFSPALSAAYLLKKHNLHSSSFELSEVVRQKSDSGVMSNSIQMRKALQQNIFNKLDINLNFPDIVHVEHEDFIPMYLASCGHKVNGDSIVIAHSNAQVNGYNRSIRENLFPGYPEITNGDKVIVTANCSLHGMFISNGDFGFVRNVYGDTEVRNIKIKRKSEQTKQAEEINVPLYFRDIEIGFRGLDGKPYFFKVKVIENLLYSDQPTLNSDENKALYVDFCIRNPRLKPKDQSFKEKIRSDIYFNALKVKFGYAITCHKAQGSEWKNVFVNCKTHQSSLTSDYFRWFYTAITRTVSMLYLQDEPHIKLGSNIAPVSTIHSTNEMIHQTKSNDLDLPATTTENHHIPKNNTFLTAIFNKVKSLTSEICVQISDIDHNQYQEAYFFQTGQEFCRINISYNGKKKITTVIAHSDTEFSKVVLDKLKPLEGILIVDDTGAESKGNELVFEEDFLNDFHKLISSHCCEIGIRIITVEVRAYCQRYKFRRNSEAASFDIFYNGKKRFTKFDPVKNECSCTTLLKDISDIIINGLNS